MGECGLFSEEPSLWASSWGAAEQVFHCSITQSNDMGKINNLLQKVHPWAEKCGTSRAGEALTSHCQQHWWISTSQTDLSQLLLPPGQTPRACLVMIFSAPSDPRGLLPSHEAQVWKGTLAWKHLQKVCDIFVEGAARDFTLGLSAPWWRQH